MRTRERLVGVFAAVAFAAAAGAADGGWGVLRELRDELEGTPQSARFEQEFLPAGFASGDRESGRLSLALPECLRWDYDEPFPKSYLVCDATVWTWNPGEASGRVFRVDPEEERGLDLLRLGVDELAGRYRAEPVAAPPGTTAVRLVPLAGGGEIIEATLTVDEDGRLAELAYLDVEGNRTRFVFHDHRPLPAPASELRPPAELAWIDER